MTSVVLKILCTILIFNFCACHNNHMTSNFEVQYTDQINATDFKITINGLTSAPTAWYAIGFSKDQDMGDDDVAMCIVKTGLGTVEHYRNPNDMDPSQLLSSANRSIGFSNLIVVYANGVLTCSFTRQKRMDNVPGYFDLANSYYLLSATGTLSATGLFIFDHLFQI